MSLSQVVKQYRSDHKLSLRAFSAKCGISHAYVDQIEKDLDPRTGKGITPTIDTLQSLAKGMDISLDELMKVAGYIDSSDSSPVSDSVTDREVKSSPLPSWLSKLPPDMQEFVAEESKHGWPYLRLARGLKMQDLTEEELRAIVDTWMDAKKRYERESGK